MNPPLLYKVEWQRGQYNNTTREGQCVLSQEQGLESQHEKQLSTTELSQIVTGQIETEGRNLPGFCMLERTPSRAPAPQHLWGHADFGHGWNVADHIRPGDSRIPVLGSHTVGSRALCALCQSLTLLFLFYGFLRP